MFQVYIYYTVLAISATNGVIAMMLILTGQYAGFLSLMLAFYMHFVAQKHKEPALMILSIRRAGEIVRKCQTEHTSDQELIDLFHKELLNEMIRRGIENSEEKVKSLEIDYKDQS